jgi:hypothetical protein
MTPEDANRLRKSFDDAIRAFETAPEFPSVQTQINARTRALHPKIEKEPLNTVPANHHFSLEKQRTLPVFIE